MRTFNGIVKKVRNVQTPSHQHFCMTNAGFVPAILVRKLSNNSKSKRLSESLRHQSLMIRECLILSDY